MLDDLVQATSKRTGIAPRKLFTDAMAQTGVVDVEGQSGYRFTQWLKHGELTPIIEGYLLNFWRPNGGDKGRGNAA